MASRTSNSHPFLDPLWRRVVLVAAVAGWSLTEFYFESHTWGTMVGVFALYGAWTYLVTYVPSSATPSPEKADGS